MVNICEIYTPSGSEEFLSAADYGRLEDHLLLGVLARCLWEVPAILI